MIIDNKALLQLANCAMVGLSIVRKYSFVIIFVLFFVLHHTIISMPNSNDVCPQGVIQVPVEVPVTTEQVTSLAPVSVPVSSGRKRILIVSTWRSGSSFLGELIGSSPGVFYSFEPVTKHIPSLFKCQFPDDYMKFINETNHVKINRRVWDECQHYKRPQLCHRPQFLAQLCASFPVNLIKAVELPVKDLVSLMTPTKGDNSSTASALIDDDDKLKIIYLVRDPRSTMASRAKVKWCQANPNCKQPDRLCFRIEEDLDLLEKHFAGRDDGRYLVLKFEDLAVNVETETEKLFDFLQLLVTEVTRAFLDSHTQSNKTMDDNYPFSNVRQSDAVAYGWKTKLTRKQIDDIIQVCAPLLKRLDIIV